MSAQDSTKRAAMGRKKRLLVLALGQFLLCTVFCAAAWAEDYLDFYEQGEFALRVEKWDRAIELFTKSLQDNPNFFLAYHNRAIAYSKKGDYDKSLADLQKAVQLNPDYPDAYGLMGLVYEIRKDYASAIKVYREALSREKRPQVKRVLENYIKDAEARLKRN
jgi:tetratricopeptide (TPR) repeat protein